MDSRLRGADVLSNDAQEGNSSISSRPRRSPPKNPHTYSSKKRHPPPPLSDNIVVIKPEPFDAAFPFSTPRVNPQAAVTRSLFNPPPTMLHTRILPRAQKLDYVFIPPVTPTQRKEWAAARQAYFARVKRVGDRRKVVKAVVSSKKERSDVVLDTEEEEVEKFLQVAPSSSSSRSSVFPPFGDMNKRKRPKRSHPSNIRYMDPPYDPADEEDHSCIEWVSVGIEDLDEVSEETGPTSRSTETSKSSGSMFSDNSNPPESWKSQGTRENSSTDATSSIDELYLGTPTPVVKYRPRQDKGAAKASVPIEADTPAWCHQCHKKALIMRCSVQINPVSQKSRRSKSVEAEGLFLDPRERRLRGICGMNFCEYCLTKYVDCVGGDNLLTVASTR